MRRSIDRFGLLRKAAALAALAMTLGAALWPAAAAETWPSRPITIVLPFATGSMIDFVARAVANDLSRQFGQPVVVESKPGGGGVVAGACRQGAAGRLHAPDNGGRPRGAASADGQIGRPGRAAIDADIT